MLRYNRINLILDHVQDPSVTFDNHLDGLEREILVHEKPHSWNVHDENNMERTLEVDFAKYGVMVTERTGQRIEDITAFLFYVSVEAIEEQHERNKKQ